MRKVGCALISFVQLGLIIVTASKLPDHSVPTLWAWAVLAMFGIVFPGWAVVRSRQVGNWQDAAGVSLMSGWVITMTVLTLVWRITGL